MKKVLLALVLVSFALSGCLKTRAQLKEDGSDEVTSSKASPVQDVQPQGQYVIDELKSEITRLNGRIEDLERSQKAAAAEGASANKDEVKKLEGRIVELEQAQAQMIEALKKLQDTAATQTVSPELFEKGKNQIEAGNLDGGIDTLTAYLKTSKPKHAEEAYFLRAEAHFAQKDYKKAIVDYSKFPEKYTRSKHMPHALLKIAQSFEALGMKDDAKGFYSELVEKFPKSSEAKKARSKLK